MEQCTQIQTQIILGQSNQIQSQILFWVQIISCIASASAIIVALLNCSNVVGNYNVYNSSKKLPLKLSPQETFEAFYSFELIIEHIKKSQPTTKKNCKKIYVFFEDIQGKIIKKKLSKRKFLDIYKLIINNTKRINDKEIIDDENRKKKLTTIKVICYGKKKKTGIGIDNKTQKIIEFKGQQIINSNSFLDEGEIIQIL